MTRHLILLALLSIVVVFLLGFFSHLVTALNSLFITIEHLFNFQAGGVAIGKHASQILALILVPLIVAGLFYAVFWLVRKPGSNVATMALWMTWLILSMALMLRA